MYTSVCTRAFLYTRVSLGLRLVLILAMESQEELVRKYISMLNSQDANTVIAAAICDPKLFHYCEINETVKCMNVGDERVFDVLSSLAGEGLVFPCRSFLPKLQKVAILRFVTDNGLVNISLQQLRVYAQFPDLHTLLMVLLEMVRDGIFEIRINEKTSLLNVHTVHIQSDVPACQFDAIRRELLEWVDAASSRLCTGA